MDDGNVMARVKEGAGVKGGFNYPFMDVDLELIAKSEGLWFVRSQKSSP